jgi:hypothetical protein
MEEETVKEKNVYIDYHVVGKLNKRLNLQCEEQMLRNICTRNSIFRIETRKRTKMFIFIEKTEARSISLVPAALNLILIPVT